MSEANPVIISDLAESELPPPAKDLSEPVICLDDETNLRVEEFAKQIPTTKRLQATRWFLTFPQTDTTKEEALQRLKEHQQLKALIKGVLIAQEKHKDNHQHLHVALWLNKKLTTRDRHYFDFVCKKHGNYMVMKSGYASVNYLRKEDSTPTVYGTVPEPSLSTLPRQPRNATAGKQKKLTDLIATSLQSGSSPADIMKEYPGFYLLNKQKVDSLHTMLQQQRAKPSLKKWPANLSYRGTNYSTQQLVEWCNLNINCKRPFKQKQLYLYGPPNSRKTTFLQILMEYCTSVHIPTDEDWFDLYTDPEPQLCYIDEFKGQKKIQWLNEFLQGSQMHIKRR